jgi:hypothetical protein
MVSITQVLRAAPELPSDASALRSDQMTTLSNSICRAVQSREQADTLMQVLEARRSELLNSEQAAHLQLLQMFLHQAKYAVSRRLPLLLLTLFMSSVSLQVRDIRLAWQLPCMTVLHGPASQGCSFWILCLSSGPCFHGSTIDMQTSNGTGRRHCPAPAVLCAAGQGRLRRAPRRGAGSGVGSIGCRADQAHRTQQCAQHSALRAARTECWKAGG